MSPALIGLGIAGLAVLLLVLRQPILSVLAAVALVLYIAFQDGEPVAASNLTLTVGKVGVERDVYEFAHRQPWLYGVLCVLLAAFTGYAASRVFRRG